MEPGETSPLSPRSAIGRGKKRNTDIMSISSSLVASDRTSSPIHRSHASSADGGEFTSLRLAAFMHEPLERGNRNVMLADQPTNPAVTKRRAESFMAEQMRVILGFCIQQ
jgi:hypothetical protein